LNQLSQGHAHGLVEIGIVEAAAQCQPCRHALESERLFPPPWFVEETGRRSPAPVASLQRVVRG
jgi:hypothetical protein